MLTKVNQKKIVESGSSTRFGSDWPDKHWGELTVGSARPGPYTKEPRVAADRIYATRSPGALIVSELRHQS